MDAYSLSPSSSSSSSSDPPWFNFSSSTPFPPPPSSSSPLPASDGADPSPVLDTWRVPLSLFAVFVLCYAVVFFCGLVGNTFVVAAIAMNKTFRTATDWLISSLAFADLLILVFCLPSTLLNNLLTEWQLGSWGCKLSVWVNSTTSCASIFTLVGVTGDRYLAICHPLRQLKLKNSLLHLYILGIWVLSAVLASPNLWVYREILYDLVSGQQVSHDQLALLALDHQPPLVARLCVDTSNNIWLFIGINLLIAFLVPIVVICVLYTLIFRAVSRHTQKKLAVDNGARLRDERVKLRIAQMMFTVIVVFVLCWTPLYGLYCYFFLATDRDSAFFQFASSVLRPIFQWLSLLSSSLNPLIYIAFSQKYRRAFQSLMLFPCRQRYKEFKLATRSTFRRSSCFSEKPSMAQLLNCNPSVTRDEHTRNSPHPQMFGNGANAFVAKDGRQRPQQQQQQRKVSFTMARACPAPNEAAGTRRKMSEQVWGISSGGGRPNPPSMVAKQHRALVRTNGRTNRETRGASVAEERRTEGRERGEAAEANGNGGGRGRGRSAEPLLSTEAAEGWAEKGKGEGRRSEPPS